MTGLPTTAGERGKTSDCENLRSSLRDILFVSPLRSGGMTYSQLLLEIRQCPVEWCN